MGDISLVFSGVPIGIAGRCGTFARWPLLRVPMTPVPAMASVAEHMNQRTRCQQQERQIRQTKREMGAVLGEQVVRGNNEQKPEPDAQLPRTLGARAVRMDASP